MVERFWQPWGHSSQNSTSTSSSQAPLSVSGRSPTSPATAEPCPSGSAGLVLVFERPTALPHLAFPLLISKN